MLPLKADTCAMAVMAKASLAGRTKTRLVPPLTEAEAAQFNTAFLQDIADNMICAGAHAAIQPGMAFAPAGSETFFRDNLPPDIELVETVAPYFGDCLHHAAKTLLARYSTVCLLNSDSPTLPMAYLVTAVTALAADGDRMVIGPSTDGGYYLIGLKHAHKRLFADIDWSTERVFGQTMERAREIKLPVVTLPTWYDVDDADTLRGLAAEVLAGQPFRIVGTQPTAARASRALLRQLIETAGLSERLGLPGPKPGTANDDDDGA
jgi:uncharacterized protein